MRSTRSHLISALAAALLAFCKPQPAATNDHVGVMQNDSHAVSIALTDKPYVIRVALTNSTDHDLELRRADMPWYERRLIMFASAATTHMLLSKTYELDDTPPGTMLLKRRQTLSEDIDLRRWFPILPETLKSDDVILLWSYELRPRNQDLATRYYGGVTLRRTP